MGSASLPGHRQARIGKPSKPHYVRGRMKRAIFLFNHDAAHQVAHLASIAAATARECKQVQSIIAYSTPAIRSQLEAIISPEDAALLVWEELTLPRWAQALARVFDRVLPATRLLRLRLNKALFASADLVVSTERTCLRTKGYLPADETPLYAYIPHGSGDRSVAYHPDIARFDQVFVSGQKVVDQLAAHGVDPNRIEIVGYPKFEGIDLSATPDFFGNGRPTFVYNPHFDPHLSSWYDAGPNLLRWFASEAGSEFNCIFAPHVMLFRKELHVSPEFKVARRRPDIPPEAMAAPNILIDVDSPRLFDMSYMLGSDAYIGDVSSQMYEFLARRRPAFYLDCRARPDADDEIWHMFWKSGPRVSSVEELTKILPDFARIGAEYRRAQDELLDYTFSITEVPASVRTARVIQRMLA